MNIKRILSGICVCLLVVSMCIGIAACGPNAKSVSSQQVTEEDWKDAFETLLSENAHFTVEYLSEQSIKYKHETMIHKTKWTAKTTESYTYIKNGPLESKIGYANVSYKGDKDSAENHCNTKAGKTKIEQYVEIVDGTVYKYEKNLNKEWEKTEVYDSFPDGFYYIALVANSYGSYEYSKEHKGYVVKGYEEGDALIVYKFKDSKLVAVYSYYEKFDEESRAQEYNCSTLKSELHITIKYSAKTIKLPTVAK